MNEEIIGNYTRMVGYQKQSPSILSLRNGTTVLTNKRIIFLRSRLGETRYDDMEKVEKDLQKEDSFSINRGDITGAFSDTKVRVPYFTLEYDENGETKYATFTSADMRAIINLVILFRRELLENDPNYVKEKRYRDKILIDQTHEQQDITLQGIYSIIRASALEQSCEDPVFFTDSIYISEEKRKSWNKIDDLLKETAMFISIGTQLDKFNQDDIDIIKGFVQKGGTFFITPDPKKKPPNKLAEIFGFRFGEKAIQDRKNHGLFRDHILVTDFQDHPANKETESIMFGDHGCYPIYFSENKGIPIAVSSKDSNPSNSIVAAEIPFGRGRVLAVGQCRIFLDDYLGEEGNMFWLKNLIDYGLSMDNIITQITSTPESIIEEKTQLKAMFCSNCGQKLEPDNVYCGNCGQKIT